jgi:hypothetical protein
VGFEIANGYLGCIASVAAWWHQFHIQFACVTNVILHVVRYLVVKDIFVGGTSGPFELVQECIICPYHLGILAVLHGFHVDGVAVNFCHNHDVFVSRKRLDGESACLVREHGFVYHVRLGVHIANLLAMMVVVLHVSSSVALTLVDLTFFLVWFRRPFAVLVVLG